MPTPARVPGELRLEPFLGSAALAAGLLTRGALAGPSWRSIFRDVYVHRDVPVTHALRARGAVLLVPHAVVSGRSAAVLWGVELAGADEDVELTVQSGSHMVRVLGLVVRRAVLAETDVRRSAGIPLTSPQATAIRLASAMPFDAAVAAVDQLVNAGVVDLAAVRAAAGQARGPGSARAREVARWADGLAGSPQETRVRLVLHRSRLPDPVAQHVVTHRGTFVARVDFAWPEHRVALEYDGLWHAEPGQFARDRRRLNALLAAGWRVVFVTAADLRRPDQLLARVAAALADTPPLRT